MTSVSAATPLHLTSEGLWIAAALAQVSALPPVLRIRPIRNVSATLTDHPGLTTLTEAGVLDKGTLAPEVAECLRVLGRPDIEIDILITRPDQFPQELLGPPPLPPSHPGDLIATARALSQWNAAGIPPQRVIVLCRRGPLWASAARMWKPGEDGCDEVVITLLGTPESTPVSLVTLLLGYRNAVRFADINIEADSLTSTLSAWQVNPELNLRVELAKLGLSVPQTRIVESAADAGSVRSCVSVAQFGLAGETRSPLTVTVSDTMLGRVLIAPEIRDDRSRWMSILSGTDTAVQTAITNLLHTLPAGSGWVTHQRIGKEHVHD